jgi:hypothetical protein
MKSGWGVSELGRGSGKHRAKVWLPSISPTDGDEDNEASEWTTCHKCGAPLVALLGFQAGLSAQVRRVEFHRGVRSSEEKEEWVN